MPDSREPAHSSASSRAVTRSQRIPALHPFLRWPGGKRWLVASYPECLPRRIGGRYLEPFLGGGTVFFHLRPARAVLSDINKELIQTYKAVQSHPRAVEEALWDHHLRHREMPDEHYYTVRGNIPENLAERAARFIYLNRTCFNGIYRVNFDGQFNVPRGTKRNVILDEDVWNAWSEALEVSQLCCVDFEVVVDEAERGDFVFADPPYTVRHNLNGFVKYNEVLFSWEDQVRLAEALVRARKRGVRILMTNANHDSVRSLYGRGFKVATTARFSAISANAAGRNAFEELIVTT